eukprot:CAMPEP_0177541182 /NCGR_PEP_ID=MMETSP0369-20130122/60031_1 /TAXON_ID=447022 ORGANISM="Scrippsiella hangoei-like, Strain SHHI-4" /NCGR_SAMPLE_ID=MMETSP0369 /ASSEMBLY_ACC=CAM_ASM_000364 /LENGTH=33 /DNA_ID= /DNA_START= /DNA_END= /DNA_ORIENTATION=
MTKEKTPIYKPEASHSLGNQPPVGTSLLGRQAE